MSCSKLFTKKSDTVQGVCLVCVGGRSEYLIDSAQKRVVPRGVLFYDQKKTSFFSLDSHLLPPTCSSTTVNVAAVPVITSSASTV